MKAAFLCNSEKWIHEVYAPETVKRIKALTELDERVCTYKDLISGGRNLADAEYIFSTWGMPALTTDEIKKYLPNLKAVFYAAGSVQEFARPFLKCGADVFSAWAANAVPVAEYTAAQIILANKGFFRAAQLASCGKRKEAYDEFKKYPGNYGAKIGIIGAGMIGKRVIGLLKSYRLEIMVFDPFLENAAAQELGVKKVSLETLFESCNVISNHLANNAQTKGMLNYALFSKFVPNATFLNTGRGAQVVESDLCRILAERSDVTAILDVTDPEPPLPDSPFLKLENCILTPHIAGSSGFEVRRMSAFMADELERAAGNMPTRFKVTEKMLDTMA